MPEHLLNDRQGHALVDRHRGGRVPGGVHAMVRHVGEDPVG